MTKPTTVSLADKNGKQEEEEVRGKLVGLHKSCRFM